MVNSHDRCSSWFISWRASHHKTRSALVYHISLYHTGSIIMNHDMTLFPTCSHHHVRSTITTYIMTCEPPPHWVSTYNTSRPVSPHHTVSPFMTCQHTGSFLTTCTMTCESSLDSWFPDHVCWPVVWLVLINIGLTASFDGQFISSFHRLCCWSHLSQIALTAAWPSLSAARDILWTSSTRLPLTAIK